MPRIPTHLEILRTRVSVPAFHEAGHTVAELPGVVPVNDRGHTPACDLVALPDVARRLRRQALDDAGDLRPVGIATVDRIAYGHSEAAAIGDWCRRRFPDDSDARQRAYWRLAAPVGILERIVAKNVITDLGATNMLKQIGSAAPATYYNHLVLATGAVTAQISGQVNTISAGIAAAVTSVPVASGGTNFTNGMTITLGLGTANQEDVTVTTGATATSIPLTAGTAHSHNAGDPINQRYASGATSLAVVAGGASFTNGMSFSAGVGGANAESLTAGSGSTGTSVVTGATTKEHYANDWLIQNPLTSDNPSSVASGYDSGALTSGAYTYSGTGAGNRQVQAVYNFPAASGAPSSGYTDLWVASTGTIAAGTTAAHITGVPYLVNSTTGVSVTYSDKM